MTNLLSDLTITDYKTDKEVIIPKKYVTYFDVMGSGETWITIQIPKQKTKNIFYLLKNKEGKVFNLDFIHEKDGTKTIGTYMLKKFTSTEKSEGVIEIDLEMRWQP
jgi:hypothetical protein